MLLTRFISKNCIADALKAKTKPKALKELTDLLFREGMLDEVGPALEQLMLRESTESTGIGRGLAIPHARVAGLENLVCAVGRCRAGLDFKALDRRPVHLIFLICYPPSQQTTYINFLATLASLLRDEDRMQAVLHADTADEIFEILERTSETLLKPEDRWPKETEVHPELSKTKASHADLILLARLELCTEMVEAGGADSDEISRRIENIRALVDARILQHYDQLKKQGGPALVAVEADTCQGCFRQLPSQLAQLARSARNEIHTCSYCSRFIYSV
jgi:mannitol/fructose-specific phosphotransferase system IIA component (Ntr-type)